MPAAVVDSSSQPSRVGSALAWVRDLLDRQMGRVTMYRLVTITLLALIAIYCGFTAAGVIAVPTGENLLALGVLLVAAVVSNRLLGLVWRARPHTESAIITALLLFFLFVPLVETNPLNLGWLAAAPVLANLSKYLLCWRGRHLFNPAAAGALLVVVIQDLLGRQPPITGALWQTAATEKLLPFMVLAAAAVLWRTRRLPVGLTFAAVAYGLVVLALTSTGAGIGFAATSALSSYPIIFIAGYMVTEPLTLPPRRSQQLIVAGVTGVLVAAPLLASLVGWSLFIRNFGLYPEVAILLGNLVAFALARRTGIRLELVSAQDRGLEFRELAFRPTRPLRFTPGQYAELHVSHRGADRRGVRRVFSIASAPADELVRFGMRVPVKSSSFKGAIGALQPGAVVHATGVGGDFVLPVDRSEPVALIAGGVGITPFLSQLADAPGRDAVLVYGLPTGAAIPFAAELSAYRVVVVAPEQPVEMPPGWKFVAAPLLTSAVVAQAVPDLAQRKAFISGPPAMVNALRPGIKRIAKSVSTDYFSGY